MPEALKLTIDEDRTNEFPKLHELELPSVLWEAWGSNLRFVRSPEGLLTPLVYGNFVMSKEGIYNLRENVGGGPISQGNGPDALGMLILRAAADAVMVGSGTLNSEPGHEWSTEYIFDHFGQMRMEDQPEIYADIERFRNSLKKRTKKPATIIMTNSGKIKWKNKEGKMPHIFQPHSGIETMIVTGARGEAQIKEDNPQYTNVHAFGDDVLDIPEMMEYLRTELGIEYLLHEGGREVLDAVARAGCLHELFLTHMQKSPAGDFEKLGPQYLFHTPDHMPPHEAQVVERRVDKRSDAYLYNYDYQEARSF